MSTELIYRAYYFNNDGRFLIQHDKYLDGTEIFIETRTNKNASTIDELLPKIQDLTAGVNFTSNIEIIIKSPDDISDFRLQQFLAKLSPQINLPVQLTNARFFLDSTNNDVIVLNFVNRQWIFYRPTDSYPIPIEFNELISRSFKETTFETIQPLIKPVDITPFPVKDPSHPLKYFPFVFEPDRRGYTTSNILEIFDENFGRHQDLSTLQYQVAQKVIPKKLADFIASNKSVISSLNTNIMTSKNQNLKNLFIVVNFLRSYVDLYHDILNFGHIYSEQLRKMFESSILIGMNSEAKNFYKEYIELIVKNTNTKIFTSGGNINQTRCKQIIETLVDDFIEILHDNNINWIPLTKENAFVKSINISNEIDFKELVKTLISDGVNTFYVESANCSIGRKLVDAGMSISDLAIGGWDAGSGFSGSKKMPKLLIGPGKEIEMSNPLIDMFGFLKVEVTDDNRNLIFTIPKKFTCTIPNGPIKLSVNSIMKTIGAGIVRGDSDINVKNIKTMPQIELNDELYKRASFIALKTWTDLIQIVSISNSKVLKHTNSKKPLKIATVIYDGLCETTSRLYGLGHVLKTEGSIVTYYNYDINSRSLSRSEIETKLKVKIFIGENKEDIFDRYLKPWFDNRIETLSNLEKRIHSPALFFVSKLFKGIYTRKLKEVMIASTMVDTLDVKLFPDTITEYVEGISASASTLGSLLDYFARFNNAIEKVLLLRPRSPIEVFLNAYDSVRQQIINTFGDSTDLELRSMIACTFAYAFITRPAHTQFFIALDTIKESIIKKFNEKASNEKILTPNQILQFFVKDDIYAQSKNMKNFTERYLPLINKIIAYDAELGLALRNISDIEIAFQLILTSIPYIKQNENNDIITYKDYIQAMEKNRPIFSYMPIEFSFYNVISLVISQMEGLIGSGIYSGGKKQNNKQRTYGLKKLKTHGKRNIRSQIVKRFVHTKKNKNK